MSKSKRRQIEESSDTNDDGQVPDGRRVSLGIKEIDNLDRGVELRADGGCEIGLAELGKRAGALEGGRVVGRGRRHFEEEK